jgi:hypothetical protein
MASDDILGNCNCCWISGGHDTGADFNLVVTAGEFSTRDLCTRASGRSSCASIEFVAAVDKPASDCWASERSD